MKAPTWMLEWRNALIAESPEVEIDLEAFKAGQAIPRRLKDPTPARTMAVTANLPRLTARVGRKLSGDQLESAFRVDLHREGEHVRSLAVAWRRDPGTFIVLRCAKDAQSVGDGVNWIVEVQAGEGGRLGNRPLAYKALYSHLNDGGHSLRAEQVGLVRNVVRTLHGLGLRLEPAEIDPRRRPMLLTTDSSPSVWLSEVVKTVVARILCAGLLGSKRWTEESRTLLGWSNEEFADFAYAWRWRGLSSVTEAALERDLCNRFTRWAQAKKDVQVVTEDSDGVLGPMVDGQRPDLRVVERSDVAVLEAKLGLTRSSIRTGLGQAREYAFHLQASGCRWPVLLLLGEEPNYHGHAFAKYVEDAAGRLGIGIVVERGGTDFIVWKHAPGGGEQPYGGGLVGGLCT